MTDPPPANPDTSGVSTWRRASTFERGIYTNLARWLARRPDLGPTGTTALPYVGIVRATLWLWIGASAVEMVVVHAIVPWPWVRWPLLVVGIWGLLWMLGLLAGLVIHPHLVEPTCLRVRNGHTVEIVVPATGIQAVQTYAKALMSSRTVQLLGDDDPHLFVAVSSQANVHLTLAEPLVADLPGGRYTFIRLSFWADDPVAAVARLRDLVAADR